MLVLKTVSSFGSKVLGRMVKGLVATTIFGGVVYFFWSDVVDATGGFCRRSCC